MKIDQTIQIIRRNRLMIGEALLQAEKLHEQGIQGEEMDALMLAINRRFHLISGMMFVLREIMTPPQFWKFVEEMKMPHSEITDMQNAAVS